MLYTVRYSFLYLLLFPGVIFAMHNNDNNNYGSINNDSNSHVNNTSSTPRKDDCAQLTLCCAEVFCLPCFVCQAGYHKWNDLEVDHKVNQARKRREIAEINSATMALYNGTQTESTRSESQKIIDEKDETCYDCTPERMCTWVACWPCLIIPQCIKECDEYITPDPTLANTKYAVKLAQEKAKYTRSMREIGFEENRKAVEKFSTPIAHFIYPENYRAITSNNQSNQH